MKMGRVSFRECSGSKMSARCATNMGKSCHHVVFNDAKKKNQIKSNPGSLYLPSSDGVGTRCALLARLVFDRVSRVGLFLFVCVCARARAREGGWGK